MPTEPVERRFVWLLGGRSYQRLYIKFWGMTSAAYCVILLLQYHAQSSGLISAPNAMVIRSMVLAGMVLFFVAMRSGWSLRFSDPSLSMAQMVYALATAALSYFLNPNLSVISLMFTPLILLFGAFTMSPRQCWQMGGFAIFLQMLTAALSQFPSHAVSAMPLPLQWIVFFTCMVVYAMTAGMAGRLSAMRAQLRSQKLALSQSLESNLVLARQDSLTNLPNRRYALELLQNEELRVQRLQVRPCVCIIDIDHFKNINDTHGHAAGDEVLRLFSLQVAAALRTSDVLTRWGGEEFMLLMPETSLPEAMRVVERLHVRLAQADIWQQHAQLQVTFSAGIAAQLVDESMVDTVARADSAMYRAKQRGRNCTVQA